MQPGDGKNDHSSNLFSISRFLEIQDTINNRCNVCRVDTKSGHLPYKICVIDHLKRSKKLCILSRWVLLDLIWQRLDRRESQVCNLDETKQSFVSLNLTDIVCPESWLLLLASSDSLYVSQNYLTSIQSVIKITKRVPINKVYGFDIFKKYKNRNSSDTKSSVICSKNKTQKLIDRGF